MTIAAGLLCRDGVILCADTEYTGSQHKSQDSKIDNFGFPGGKIAYAFAGHEENARAAIDKLQRELFANQFPPSVRDVIDRVVDRQYRKNVAPYNDTNLDYQLLLAYWGQQTQHTELYVTRRTAVRPVRSFSCIGYGGEFASHILKPQFHRLSSDRDAWHICAYMLALVKRAVPYCGGASIFMMLQNDGEIGVTTSELPNSPVQQIENFARVYDWLIQQLFLSVVNPTMSNDDFERTMDGFKNSLLKSRTEWSRDRDKWLRQFRESNEHLHPDAALIAYLAWSMGLMPKNLPPRSYQADQSNPESTTADSSHQQPSPESPGGTDES
jgi:20S proteasome alpha/beta subunit